MKTVLIVQPISEEGVKMLTDEGYNVNILNDHSIDNIKKNVVNADAIIVRTADITKDIIEAGENLKVISRHGKGVDNIDVETASNKGIYVTNAPESNITSTAEHVMALIIALSKKIKNADLSVRRESFDKRSEYIGLELSNKNLGIIGVGKIGSCLASIALNGFKMNVIAYDPYLDKDNLSLDIKLYDEIDYVLKNSDFISLNLPYNKNTKNLINENRLSKMKKTSYLINCSRGPIVNEKDVYDALKSKNIAGAAFDVFQTEPPSKNCLLFELDNVLLTPHIAGLTDISMVKMAKHSAQGVIEVLNNQNPTWPVNFNN